MGYTPSTTVNNAWNHYQGVASSRPDDYESAWQQQLDDLYGQISNRKPFAYDMNGDALYQQYKDKYTQMGQQGAQNAMGQASAMTGGYTNSFAQSAAQMAYQEQMTALGSTVPGLEQRAYGRYQDQGQDLLALYGITQANEDSDYARYRDTVGDWQTERDFTYNKWDDLRDFGYNSWNDQRNYDLARR